MLWRHTRQQVTLAGFLDALSADLSQPLFKGLGLGAGDRLDDTQQRFGISGIRFASFPVKGAHFQPVTICHHFIAPSSASRRFSTDQ